MGNAAEEGRPIRRAEQFEIKLDLEEQMHKLQQKKIEEDNRKREGGMKVKKLLLQQLMAGKEKDVKAAPQDTDSFDPEILSENNSRLKEEKRLPIIEKPSTSLSTELEELSKIPITKNDNDGALKKEEEKGVEKAIKDWKGSNAPPKNVIINLQIRDKPPLPDPQIRGESWAKERSDLPAPQIENKHGKKLEEKNVTEKDMYQFPALGAKKPPLVVTPKMMENKATLPRPQETGRFAVDPPNELSTNNPEIEEDYSNASFENADEPGSSEKNRANAVTFGKHVEKMEAAIAPVPEVVPVSGTEVEKAEDKDEGKMIVVGFGDDKSEQYVWLCS